MAALHLLATQSTQLPRAPIYPYARETVHPLLSGPPRRGKWTPEEEAYAAATIQYFLRGILNVQYGTMLRGYIAQLLHCDPMRVSKKLIPGTVFAGVKIDPKIGRRSYYPCASEMPGLDVHKAHAESHLEQLRQAFIESLEREAQQEQAALQPQRPPIAVSRASSPPKRKRDEEDVTPPPAPARYQPTGMKTLPSLVEMLQKNRSRRAPEYDGYPASPYSYANAAPSPSTWPQPSSEPAPFEESTFPVPHHERPPSDPAVYPPPPPTYSHQ